MPSISVSSASPPAARRRPPPRATAARPRHAAARHRRPRPSAVRLPRPCGFPPPATLDAVAAPSPNPSLSLATTRRRRPPPPAKPPHVPLPTTLPILPPLLADVPCSGDGKRQFQTVCLASQSQVSRREPVPLFPDALLHLAGAPDPPITHRWTKQFDVRCPGCVQFSAAPPPSTSTTSSQVAPVETVHLAPTANIAATPLSIPTQAAGLLSVVVFTLFHHHEADRRCAAVRHW